ncbi:hypothetical protein H9P43_009432, partial [Blastocladiella emersonii ATCC 22665]
RCTPQLRDFAMDYIPDMSPVHILRDDRADRMSAAVLAGKFTPQLGQMLDDVFVFARGTPRPKILEYLLQTPYLGFNKAQVLANAVRFG